ncbi:MAG: 2'-deoxycytidine 5'-triphosphate deaminase, partial [Pseudomonadota bacterium]
MADPDGILSDRQIAALFDGAALTAGQPLQGDQIQPASLDLRLGAQAFRVRASFLPGEGSSVADKLERFKLHAFDLTQGAVLETGCVYIVPLLEGLALPQDVAASANPKSSTGRLDIFTRVITDRAQQFDMVPAGYNGPLYLEISPRTFPVLVRTGSRLSQIRFRRGDAVLTREELQTLHEEQTLVAAEAPSIEARGIAMSIDLTGDETGLVGYRGKRHTGVVDVDKKAAYSVLDYWEPIYGRGPHSGEIVLDPDEFYILVSREAVHVPPSHAAEMVPFDPLVGEFRVHYAGFF